MGAGSLRCAGNDNGCAVAGADAAGARSAHIRRSREGSDRGYLGEFVEQGQWVSVTAAASVHVRTALGDKAFDEASSRGLALTLGDAVAYAENQVRAALAGTTRCGADIQSRFDAGNEINCLVMSASRSSRTRGGMRWTRQRVGHATESQAGPIGP